MLQPAVPWQLQQQILSIPQLLTCRLYLSNPVQVNTGFFRFKQRQMSLRTSGVAVAVNAIIGTYIARQASNDVNIKAQSRLVYWSLTALSTQKG